jgi:hypothetical protein
MACALAKIFTIPPTTGSRANAVRPCVRSMSEVEELLTQHAVSFPLNDPQFSQKNTKLCSWYRA